MVIHLAHGQSNSSGLTGCGNGIIDFFSLSLDNAFLISVRQNKISENIDPYGFVLVKYLLSDIGHGYLISCTKLGLIIIIFP